jgi:pyrroloquinoline quinone (PQQ) biosynthesis protein C
MSFYQQLQMETAVERGKLFVAPIIGAALSGQVDRTHYLNFLARAFHHVKHTVSLLMACGARLSDRQEWLRQAIAHYIEEEIGHHEWILNDITAAGGNAENVRHSTPDRDTELMVAYAYDTVLRGNPIGLLGMVFVLEGTSVSLACNIATLLQKNLNLPPLAFTYLNSHGTLDIEHMGHFERLVNQLTETTDQQSVLHCANMFFHLYGNVLRGIDMGVCT